MIHFLPSVGRGEGMTEIHSSLDPRGVATLTIDRPQRKNALDSAAMAALAEALHALERVKADLFIIQDRLEREIISVQRQLHDQR